MNIHERIEFAIDNALVIHYGAPESVNDFAEYTDKPDDYPIHMNPEPLPDVPYVVSLEAGHELGLKRLLSAYEDVVQRRFSEGYVAYVEKHEGEHLQAARMLGATSAQAGLMVCEIKRWDGSWEDNAIPFIRLQDFKTTKLGAALVAAYPEIPSPGDEEDIRGYGYSDVEELTGLAIRRNAARKPNDPLYPVPLSANNSGIV